MTEPHDPDDPTDEPWLEPELEATLARALRSAYAPRDIEPARHRQILGAALEDPLAPPSADELRESERLRQALETGDDTHPSAALARALGAAARPATLPPEHARRVRERALRRRPNVVFATFGAAALAAAAVLAFSVTRPRLETQSAPLLARSRSTSELFHERFEPGQASARIDRIASSRERDGRDNQYALWGVR